MTSRPVRSIPERLSPGSHYLHRLVSCVRSLGPWLGWKYWRVENKVWKHPELVSAWATRCRREAIIAPEPLRSAYLNWAEELETCLEIWQRQEAANKQIDSNDQMPGQSKSGI